MVGVVGFELTTLCSQSRCANQTALHPDERGELYSHEKLSSRGKVNFFCHIFEIWLIYMNSYIQKQMKPLKKNATMLFL